MRRIIILGGASRCRNHIRRNREIIVLVIRKNKVSQPDLGSFESLMIGQAVLVEFWRTDDQAADIELVEVAVRPGKRRLKHFVELGEVQCNRQLKGAAHLWLDVEDVGIG